MGNAFSSVSTEPLRLATRQRHVPKYLRPAKLSRKQQRQLDAERAALAEKEDEQSHHGQDGIEWVNGVHGHLNGSEPSGEFGWLKGCQFRNFPGPRYPLPSDQVELDRLRILFFILEWALEGIVLAPIHLDQPGGANVLSVGCGPGVWLGHAIVDLALDYPRSQFTAVDVNDLLPARSAQQDIQNLQEGNASPVNRLADSGVVRTRRQGSFPSLKLSSHPSFNPLHPALMTTEASSATTTLSSGQQSPWGDSSLSDSFSSNPSSFVDSRRRLDNLSVHAINVTEQALPFADNTFDFVVQRLVTVAFTVDDWRRVLRELVRVTKPGGYVQLVEIDYETKRLGPFGRIWANQLLDEFRAKRNVDARMACRLSSLLTRVGLENVQKKMVSIPLGKWGLDIGVLWQQNVEAFMTSAEPFMVQAMHLDPESYKQQWDTYWEELGHVKAFNNVHAVWGRKPTTEGVTHNLATYHDLPSQALHP